MCENIFERVKLTYSVTHVEIFNQVVLLIRTYYLKEHYDQTNYTS